MMKKILEILGPINGGGVSSMVFNYLSHMDLSDLEIHILAFNLDGVKVQAFDGLFKNLGCTVHYIHHRNKGYILHFRTYRKLLINEQFDIVHCHLGLWSAPYLSIAKNLNVGARIGHAHGSASEYSTIKTVIVEAMRPVLISSANYRMACGARAGEYVWGKYNFEIVYNAVDLQKFKFNLIQRENYRKSLGLNGYVIGFVGRLCKEKNLPFLIQIIRDTQKKYGNKYKFLIIGDGEERDTLNKSIAAEKINENTLCLGQRTDISELMSAMDCLILPSLHEGFPVVLVEAQATGLRVLASDKVSQEVKILESLEFLSIDAGTESWVNSIGENKIFNRDKCTEDLRKAGFDIDVEGKKLKEKYINI